MSFQQKQKVLKKMRTAIHMYKCKNIFSRIMLALKKIVYLQQQIQRIKHAYVLNYIFALYENIL